MQLKDKISKISEEVALYIHIPFCKQKCLYCDFTSFCGREESMIDYSKALAKDIENAFQRKIKTIFIGGGTPTYLSLEAWNNIKSSIDKLERSTDLEFTVEGNPGTFTEEKLIFLKNMGVNRLSIGLQAWQNSILNKLGRIHTVEEFIESYNMARSVGFSNINVDLMFGLPNQSLDDWRQTLEKVIQLSPEHISCYSLIIEENTTFYKMYNDKELYLPEEELERNMYNYAINLLDKNGYNRYEISNFSKIGRQCRHNLVYWNLEEYIGCGVGAHSYVDHLRYRKTENIEEYIREINLGNNLKQDIHKNTIEDDMEEFMFMGLRKIEGISIKEFYRRFNKDIFSVYEDIIEKHKCTNMLIEDKNKIFFSNRGLELSNSIMCDFILK